MFKVERRKEEPVVRQRRWVLDSVTLIQAFLSPSCVMHIHTDHK